MTSGDTGDEPYHPSYLLFNEFFVDPTAATFFSNQLTSAGPVTNLPVATAYNTLNKGNLAEQSSKPSSLTSIRKEPTDAIFSAPTFSGNSTTSSVASLSSNLVKGNTICASRCAPHSDIQFRPVGRPTHLGTVAAQQCAPKPNATFSRSFEQRPDTVIATPMLKQSAKLLSRPQQYPHVYAPPAGALLHAPPPEDTVYSSPSYDSQLDLGYSSNYSLRDHYSSYQLPDVTKPSPGNRVAHHYPSSGYKCAGFGAHLNALNSTSNVKDGLSRKRCRDNGTSVRRSRSEKSPPPMKRKYTKKKSASTDETTAHGASQHPKASKSYASTMFHANPELNAVASGVSTTKQEVYCGKNIIAFEKGQFLIRIGDIRNLDHADDVIWLVQSYDRLQKYILKDMDCHANREYARSDSVSPFISNELWRYYPLNATTLRINEEQESVIVSHFPSNEEIVRYQTNNMGEKPSARINIEPNNFNMFRTGGNVMAVPNRQFMNDTGKIGIPNEIAERRNDASFTNV